MRKKGKRPRGRPRKILVSPTRSRSKAIGGVPLTCDVQFQENLPEPQKTSSSSSGSSSSSSDSSSSCSSSSSSEEEEEQEEGQVNPSIRTRDHPVPQKKAQIVMAKQEPPLKRSRKPPPPDPNKSPRKVLKTYRESSLPGTIKKPVHPASFTFMGFHRGSARDPAGGLNRSSLTSAGSGGVGRSGPSRNLDEGKTLVSGGLKGDTSKAKEAQNPNTSRSLSQGSAQQIPSSPSGPKRLQGPAAPQRTPSGKAAPSLPSKAPPGQGSGPQPLNLQSKLVQAKDATGSSTSPVRNATTPAKKSLLSPNRQYSPPRTPAAPGRLPSRKALQDKVPEKTEIQKAKVQTRLEKSSIQKPPELLQDRSAAKDGKKKNEMSAGEDESSSESDQDQNASVAVQNQDWKPMRSLIEHVFVTDVTANLVTVTVKESPTSVGFFSLRNY